MHSDVTAVTKQPNKIVLSEVKDNQALLEPLYGTKPKELFGQPGDRGKTYLNGERGEFLLVDCSFVNCVRHGQVDHFTEGETTHLKEARLPNNRAQQH